MSENSSVEIKKKILIICNYYLPGFKSGGSLRTIVNMVERLSDEFEFKIITLDHDGDKIRYKNIEVNKWCQAKNAQVFYLSQDAIKLLNLRKLINDTQPDAIYLNSVFATLTIFVLILKKIGQLPECKIVLAPEGELSVGALGLKAEKKKVFLKAAKITGLYNNLIWKTTSELEKKEVELLTSKFEKIFIASNMPAGILLENYRQNEKPLKTYENTRLIFLSRHMPKKNLNWFIKLLSTVKLKAEQYLTLDIFGPIEDAGYWRESQELIKELPANVKVTYKGSVSYNQVLSTLFNYHYFVLPTLGENFGHVFIEALAAGCPVITSNRTPWLGLDEKQIGWDLPLEKPQQWLEVLDRCISTDQAEYKQISSNARSFATDWLLNSNVKEATRKVLEYSTNKNFN